MDELTDILANDITMKTNNHQVRIQLIQKQGMSQEAASQSPHECLLKTLTDLACIWGTPAYSTAPWIRIKRDGLAWGWGISYPRISLSSGNAPWIPTAAVCSWLCPIDRQVYGSPGDCGRCVDREITLCVCIWLLLTELPGLAMNFRLVYATVGNSCMGNYVVSFFVSL